MKEIGLKMSRKFIMMDYRLGLLVPLHAPLQFNFSRSIVLDSIAYLSSTRDIDRSTDGSAGGDFAAGPGARFEGGEADEVATRVYY